MYEIWIGKYFYQGSAKDIHARCKVHLQKLVSGKHGNKKMQNVFNKHRVFDYNILVECNREAAFKYEQDFIDSNFGDELYLNIRPGAIGGNPGYPCSEIKRQKLSKAQAGKSPGNKGKTMTEAQREKMRGKRPPLSEEHKTKIAEGVRRKYAKEN